MDAALVYIRHTEPLPVIIRLTDRSGRVYSLHAQTWEWRDAVDWPWTAREGFNRGDVTTGGSMDVAVDGQVVGHIFHQPFSYPATPYWANMNPLRFMGIPLGDHLNPDYHDSPPYNTPMAALMHFVHNAERMYEAREKTLQPAPAGESEKA